MKKENNWSPALGVIIRDKVISKGDRARPTDAPQHDHLRYDNLACCTVGEQESESEKVAGVGIPNRENDRRLRVGVFCTVSMESRRPQCFHDFFFRGAVLSWLSGTKDHNEVVRTTAH